MEGIKNRMKNMPLRKAFAVCVLVTLTAVIFLSAATIAGCAYLRSRLLPETGNAVLTVHKEYEHGSTVEAEYTVRMGENVSPLLSYSDENENQGMVTYRIKEIQSSYHALSPRRQAVYLAAGTAIVVLPLIFSLAGCLLCALWFYRVKLALPLSILSEATGHIAQQDLDFSIPYDSTDELGALCLSFEKMRKELKHTNREMCRLLEERRRLLFSVSHDLRNPIAVVKGYAEYLQINAKKGWLQPELIDEVAGSISCAAGRLERYTQSVHDINRLESLEMKPSLCTLPEMLEQIQAEMKILVGNTGIELELSSQTEKAEIWIDKEMYIRVMENLVSNAVRYAKTRIGIRVSVEKEMLVTAVTDDGSGFPDRLLREPEQYDFCPNTSGGHLGMGLVICRLISRKHGGDLRLQNISEGACASFSFYIGNKEIPEP